MLPFESKLTKERNFGCFRLWYTIMNHPRMPSGLAQSCNRNQQFSRHWRYQLSSSQMSSPNTTNFFPAATDSSAASSRNELPSYSGIVLLLLLLLGSVSCFLVSTTVQSELSDIMQHFSRNNSLLTVVALHQSHFPADLVFVLVNN